MAIIPKYMGSNTIVPEQVIMTITTTELRNNQVK